MAALFEARNVTKVFGGTFLDRSSTTALDNISMTLEDSQPSITVIAGESGSGKTTLARLLLGIIEPTSGQVLYRGKDLTRMSGEEHKTFRREVQAIFQDPFEVYNPFHKVDRVLNKPLQKFGLAHSASERRQIVEEALERVGLDPSETLGRYPHQLSGGQRQRVMVARALVLKPSIIVADEPVSMVDASLRATILESLLKLNRELGIALVYITHDLTTAYQVGDNIIVLYQGGVTEFGDVELVIKKPEHPYTQLLVDSIPLADPEQKWSQRSSTVAAESAEDIPVAGDQGCKFVPRCPMAMPVCSSQTVPVFRTHEHRGVACFLYQDSPALTDDEVSALISRPAIRNTTTVGEEG